MPSLATLYEQRQLYLQGAKQQLERRTVAALGTLPHVDRVIFRVKESASFLEKAAKDKYNRPLVEIEDQVAGRVIVFFLSDIEAVRSRLLDLFNPIESTSKRPSKDAEFGYESDHYVFVIPPWAKPRGWTKLSDPPNTFEMQVRTLFMHAYAEPQHDLAYKTASDLTRQMKRELAWVAASAWGADAAFERVRLAMNTQRTSPD